MISTTVNETEERFARIWESPTGWSGWIATVNSRPLGLRYMKTALAFFVVGILLALVMRAQLAVPDNDLLSAKAYNAVFTMHGSTMLYLFAVPFIEGLGMYLIPMLIGSRDLAFPRLTNFGYWTYLFGGLTIYSSVLFGAAPDAAWTAYPPLSGAKHSGLGLDFWLLGLSLLEIAGISAAAELTVTILKLRAPGMAVQHIPVLVWTYLVAGLMIIFAFTPLLLATLMLEMDRSFGTQFFSPELGGSSLLWQHLFWWFGHPEVYIIFLPATGVVSAIIPILSRRRLIAYPLVVAAIITTGFVSFGLWSHHMFTTGIPELPMHFFTAASFMIALASGIQIFAWIATLWGSRPAYNVAMLFILGFFIIFVNGGLTGVMVATMTFDFQVHETNFIPAHFHHVLIGGAVLPFLAGLHHWLPKFSGRMASEFWGKLAWGAIFAGFNLTFLTMYLIGLYGMRRRVYTYSEDLGVGALNLLSTVGAFLLAAGFALMLINLFYHARHGAKSGGDPWGGGSLEWSTASPPPAYGFSRPPVVRDRYPLWNRTPAGSEADDYTKRLQQMAAALESRPSHWRATLLTDVANAYPKAVQDLPGPAYLPFFVALALLLAALAVLAKSYILAAVAGVVAAFLIGGWLAREPVLEEGEAKLLSDRLELPLQGSGQQSVGWWGMISLLAVLFTAFGALFFSYFYLRLYSEQWPQAGLPRPTWSGWLMVLGLLAAAGLAQGLATWARIRHHSRSLKIGLALATVLGLGFLLGQAALLARSPFAPTANAYASIYFTLHGFVMLMVVCGMALQAGCFTRLVRKAEPLHHPRLILWLQNTDLFCYFTVALGVITFLITGVVPHIG